MKIKIRKIGRLSNKPLSLEPYLEILREHVTGDKKASVRKYCRDKLQRLTSNDSKTKSRAGSKRQPC